MADILALVEQCERASGADRELDLAIYLAMWPESDLAKMTKHRRGLDSQEGYAWTIHGASVVFEKWDGNGRCPHNGGYPLPAFSGSIDAAMTLAPAGAQRLVRDGIPGGDGEGNDRPFANIGFGFDGRGDTMALACCAACLRARFIEVLPDLVKGAP